MFEHNLDHWRTCSCSREKCLGYCIDPLGVSDINVFSNKKLLYIVSWREGIIWYDKNPCLNLNMRRIWNLLVLDVNPVF